MIALDTNVLVRLFVDEDGADRDRVLAFFERMSGADVFFVCDIVLLEFAWTLRSRYDYSRKAILDALSSLSTNDDFRFEDAASFRDAVAMSRRTGADFSDAMMAHAGRNAGCGSTMTLDRKAGQRLAQMEALP